MCDSNQIVLRDLNTIEENDLIPENVKNTLEIFNYNKEVIWQYYVKCNIILYIRKNGGCCE